MSDPGLLFERPLLEALPLLRPGSPLGPPDQETNVRPAVGKCDPHQPPPRRLGAILPAKRRRRHLGRKQRSIERIFQSNIAESPLLLIGGEDALDAAWVRRQDPGQDHQGDAVHRPRGPCSRLSCAPESCQRTLIHLALVTQDNWRVRAGRTQSRLARPHSCHCEERSDEAIWFPQRDLSRWGALSIPRVGDCLASLAMTYRAASSNDSAFAPIGNCEEGSLKSEERGRRLSLPASPLGLRSALAAGGFLYKLSIA